MASSTDDHGHVSAPPPTPSASASASHPISSSSATPSLLSHLLLRLPPTLSLSLPTRRTATITLPFVSLSSETLPSSLLSAATQLGFFQLTHHSVPPELAHSAESESFSLIKETESHNIVSARPWPVGYDDDHDSFCFDSTSFTESTGSLRELTLELERVGMEVLKAVWFKDLETKVLPLMWVSEMGQGDKLDGLGQVYPYVVGLEYQIRCRKVLLMGDSGWVSVSPKVDSILVTFGDIAQVWSNGKIKKVRGRPVPIIPGEVPNTSNGSATKCISMTMLLTLPLESIVSPQLLQTLKSVVSEKDDESDEDAIVLDSFSFEDYAWSMYHKRLHLKDSLDRYRLI